MSVVKTLELVRPIATLTFALPNKTLQLALQHESETPPFHSSIVYGYQVRGIHNTEHRIENL